MSVYLSVCLSLYLSVQHSTYDPFSKSLPRKTSNIFNTLTLWLQILRHSHSSPGLCLPIPIHHASSQPVLHHSPQQDHRQREVCHHFSYSLSIDIHSALHRECMISNYVGSEGFCFVRIHVHRHMLLTA